jgi:hypothetical protein
LEPGGSGVGVGASSIFESLELTRGLFFKVAAARLGDLPSED